MPRIIPLGELTPEMIDEIRRLAEITLRKRAAEKLKLPENQIVVRELVVGDEANAADFVDLDVRTEVTTGQQFWGQDANDLTDNTLSSILASGEKVPDGKFIGFFGFVDLTPNPDLVAIRFKRGADILDFWHVEHCYAYPDKKGGMIKGVIIYDQNDPIDIEMEFKDGSVDKYVVLLAYIAERYGETITKT